MTHKRRFIAGIVIILVVPLSAVIIGTLGFWLHLAPDDKTFLLTLIEHSRIYIFFSIFIFIAILGYIAKWMLFQYFIPLQKLAEDAEILKNSERLYTIETKGGKELKKLAVILSRHAYELKELKENINEKIQQAKNDFEEEKNILTSLVSELSDAIIICNNEGQIVLFNHHSQLLCKEQSSDDLQNRIGIGRSVYKIIPAEIIKHALEEIEHKFNQGQQDAYTQLVYPLPSSVSARIRVVPVSKDQLKIGFILIMHDITAELDKDLKRHEMIEGLIDTTRSSIAGIRAAIESIMTYQDMQEEQRRRFNTIIMDESERLGAFVNETIANYKDYFKLNWPMEQIEGQSLLNLLLLYSKTIPDLIIEIKDPEDNVWVSVENFSFINTVVYLMRQIAGVSKNKLSVELISENSFVYLDINWQDFPLSHDRFRQIVSTPIYLNTMELPFSTNDVIQRHNARIWTHQADNNLNSIRIMLKAGDAGAEPDKNKKVIYGARPEFYDFDLFTTENLDTKWEDRILSSLRFVVFDLETTGLNPSEGDEIISIGAVTIVNGKILSDRYEQLVNPGKRLNKVTTQITGITDDMLKDQPLIEKVMPSFYAYCEDAVLVAHNAAFDIRFLKLKEKQAGLNFDQPVLDTLLLSASVHVNQESHSLDAIAERFGLTIKGRHTALGDAHVTAEILLKLLPVMAEKGISNLQQAYAASKKTYYARIKY